MPALPRVAHEPGQRSSASADVALKHAGVQQIEQALQVFAERLEAIPPERSAPVRFYLRDDSLSLADRTPSAVGEKDELGAPVPGVWATFHVAKLLEAVDELGHRGE